MSITSKSVAIVASAGVLAVGWQVGAARLQQAGAPEPPAPAVEATLARSTGPSDVSPAPSPGSAATVPNVPTTEASTPPTATARTVMGGTVTHKYGTMTVTVTLTAGKITDVSARTASADSKSTTITQSALPVLRSRVLAANGVSVDAVSGATYTSKAYLTSLQSALDKA